MAGDMASAVTEVLEAAGEQLSSFQNRTAATARLVVRVNQDKLGYHTERLSRSARNILQKAGDITGRLEQSLRHLDPAEVLKRGFTITSRNSLIIRSAAELEEGDSITTHFKEGTVRSTVKQINNKNNNGKERDRVQ
jgi:exodeoxyribonuclease VII large subunit